MGVGAEDEDPQEPAEAPAGLATDPKTGSTPRDPAVEQEGPPLAGEDPMAGEAPSG